MINKVGGGNSDIFTEERANKIWEYLNENTCNTLHTLNLRFYPHNTTDTLWCYTHMRGRGTLMLS